MQSKTQTFWSVTAMAVFIILALACVTQKTYSTEERKMRNPDYTAFVEKNDGTKITGSKLKLPVNFWGATKGIYLDGKEMNATDIVAFQDSKAYYKKFKNTWVKQLKRGKLNLYYYETYETKQTYQNGVSKMESTTIQHFVFQKGDGELMEAGLTGIADILKDNQEAYDKYNATFKPEKHFLPKQLKNKPGKLFEIIDIYNR